MRSETTKSKNYKISDYTTKNFCKSSNDENTNSRYTNSIFNNNTSQLGGAIYNDDNSSLGVNNTFANNQAERGAAVFSDQGRPEFYNSIFWNNTGTVNNSPIFNDDANTVVANSIVQGGYNGDNIINSDPQFVDLQSGDLRLRDNSPGIDAGNNNFVIGQGDIVGTARILNGTVDIGAYEANNSTFEPPEPPVIPELPVNPEPSGSIELFRFRNTTVSTGTYVFVGAEEGNTILNDPNLSGSFALDGVNSDGSSVNTAFVASTEPGENLEGFYRLSSLDNPGTFLFVGQQEYDAIFAQSSDQRDRWERQGFDTEGNDIPEFYLYGVGANLGTAFNRFQNRENNTFLFAGPDETAAINSDPNLSAAFLDQGGAFEAF